MKKLLHIMLSLLILALFFIPASTLASQSFSQGIRFLDDVKEVEWYMVKGKNIIIGWKGLPDSFYRWNYKAALNASKLSHYKVHVWAVRYNQKGWSPGEGGQICMTTAIRGRLGKSNCRH